MLCLPLTFFETLCEIVWPPPVGKEVVYHFVMKMGLLRRPKVEIKYSSTIQVIIVINS